MEVLPLTNKYDELEVIVTSILEGEGLDILKKLTPSEKDIAWEILKNLKETGENLWLNQLWKLDYDEEPPTPEEFFFKPEYLKHVGDDLYPKWREELMVILSPMKRIHECIFRGCIGSGKTYVGAAITCYDIALLLHLKNPQRTLKLSSSDHNVNNSPIYWGLISSDLSQLEKMLWNYTIHMMKRSPFFRKHSNIRDEKGYKELHLPLPKNIHLVGGSLPAHILGLNLYGACLDESNYRRSADPQKEAFSFYLKLRNRIENRFIKATDRGRVILISSESDEGSFLDEHCRSITKDGAASDDVHICRFSEWEIKGHTMDLEGGMFKVDIGDNLRQPCILESGDPIRDGAIIVEVPESYRKDATRDLIEFLKERAGVVPGRANKFFYNVESLLESFQLDNPFLSDLIEMALDSEYEISDYLDTKLFLKKVHGVHKPLHHPDSRRFIHVDLAKSEDHAGISMFHVGEYSDGGSPIFYQDFAVAISASANKPIDYDKIIKFISWLKEMEFYIGMVTYDSYQSQHSLNALEKAGFNVNLRSMDILKKSSRGKIQHEYYEFRTMIGESRIKMVKNQILRKECIELLDFDGKPDHPDPGSKDIIDASVGSIANAVEMFSSIDTRKPIDVSQILEGFSTSTKVAEGDELFSQKQLMSDIKYSDEENEFINP